MTGPKTVTFLSDFGHADEFVGVVHSVIHQYCDNVRIIDLSHGIAPFDVRGGSLLLARSIQYVVPGVILAVVDPGVGTERRAIAIECADGNAIFVGPDNGVLAPAVAMLGGAQRAMVLDKPEFHIATGTATFAGRDIFAPVAAQLCDGRPLDEVGTEIETASLVPGVVPLTQIDGDDLVAQVAAVDQFGNLQLNVDPTEIEHFGDTLEIQLGDIIRAARRVTAFGELSAGELGAMLDSSGLIAIVMFQRGARDELGVDAGAEIILRAADPATASPHITAVQLGRQE